MASPAAAASTPAKGARCWKASTPPSRTAISPGNTNPTNAEDSSAGTRNTTTTSTTQPCRLRIRSASPPSARPPATKRANLHPRHPSHPRPFRNTLQAVNARLRVARAWTPAGRSVTTRWQPPFLWGGATEVPPPNLVLLPRRSGHRHLLAMPRALAHAVGWSASPEVPIATRRRTAPPGDRMVVAARLGGGRPPPGGPSGRPPAPRTPSDSAVWSKNAQVAHRLHSRIDHRWPWEGCAKPPAWAADPPGVGLQGEGFPQ